MSIAGPISRSGGTRSDRAGGFFSGSGGAEREAPRSVPGGRRAAFAAAGTGLTLAATLPASAGVVTVATTVGYSTTGGSGVSSSFFDFLFTPVQNATDLVSISVPLDGTSQFSVYTGEAGYLTIEAIGTDNSLVTLFNRDPLDMFQNVTLASVTNDSFTDFSARDIQGLRFTTGVNNQGPRSTLTLPSTTQFTFATTSVFETLPGSLLASTLAMFVVIRRWQGFRSGRPWRH